MTAAELKLAPTIAGTSSTTAIKHSLVLTGITSKCDIGHIPAIGNGL